MFGSACRHAGGLEGAEREGGQCPPCKDGGAFLSHPLVRKRCFIIRGFREKWYRGWGRIAGTIKNHRHVCRLQQETEQSRGTVP